MRRRLFVLLACAGLLAASEELNRQITRIFGSKDFASKSFGPARWIEGGNAYTTVEPAADNKDAQEVVRYETATGARSVLISAAQITPKGGKPLAIEDYVWSADSQRLLLFTNSERVWRENTRGDYWVLDRRSGALKKMGGTAPASSLMFAKFSPDATRVAYVRAQNLYVEEVAGGSIRALTSNGSETLINGTADWVYEEELNLRDGFQWSPDGRSIAYFQADSTGVEKFALINYTDSLYPKLTYIPYPKVGTTNSAVRIGVVAAKGGATRWMQIPGDLRNHYLFHMEWAGASELIIGQLNRLQNTAVLYLAESASGKTKPMFEEKNDTWVDVPEIGIALPTQSYPWINGGKSMLWLSDRDGWRHAWAVPSQGGAPREISTGPGDVIDLETADPQSQWMYYIASPQNATQRYLYRARLDGTGQPERLTPQSLEGTNSYTISPDCKWAFHNHSRFDQPRVTDLVQLPDHKTVRVLQDNAKLRAAVAPLVTPPVEFLQVKVAPDTTLDGWLLKPKNFDASKKYPLVVYVYGEPAGVTVTDSWGGGRTLFHRALADDGYLVASFDNRGTPSPKGSAWRKSIYGAVGVLSTEDQTNAVKALAESHPYVDLDRVGVWGWSGGGTNTLNLMFRSPDVYKVGVSVAPVPDQKLYDSIYQERYMGLPDSNASGYRKASAINVAEGLKGRLLVVHGTGDDNVHFQGTQKLINRLVELGKPFDFMEYPNRTHAISEGEGTSVHLYTLIARYLEEHLPAGGK